ncbi:amino acid permease 6-like isoform X1 [Salvia hispanica]|uniref:amino acid permease 6-like isoform X1 n=1 Tax=Salvia hispanica TaxID=49212 RepID=UPI002009BE35|nr:amino acid permease 6-like isoform X1 [Salvia hispanica]XP_047938204.1 amino acid permease 6-like isoform X1 [Salvia hispanica]
MNVERSNVEAPPGNDPSEFDEDGHPKRTGTVWSAGAHIITAVIGSGVLTLAWALAQMGWIAGPTALLAFSVITMFTSTLLADCYRAADGTRNYVYKDAVKSYLGGIKYKFCAVVQYSYLVGVTIGYSITTAISLVAMKKSLCFHKHGHNHDCTLSNNPFIVLFGLIQILISQVPNFHELAFLSFIAAIMSFSYASIGLGLSIAKITEKKHATTSITGKPITDSYSAEEKMWSCFAAIGNIAFAYAFAVVLIEIQDTIRSGAPESKVMKRASIVGILISTVFYMLCGALGYAAFGNAAPGNFLTGYGFYDPYWLILTANLFIAIHLFGAYQVFAQPVFGAAEGWCRRRWPGNTFVSKEHRWGRLRVNYFRVVWRSMYVVFTTLVAMLLPFFNDFVGLLGAISFWPLAVFFPIEMYMVRAKISRWSCRGFFLQLLSGFCLVASLLAGAGSIRGLLHSLRKFELLQSRS